MADSNITKRELAKAMKELLQTVPFKDISISAICEKCDMNRKSFYYHFKDKYDLVNWIYNYEFIHVAKNKEYGSVWDFLLDICIYFYDNKPFYKKVLKVEGQNSFSEYFRELLIPIAFEHWKEMIPDIKGKEFYVKVLTEAFISIIEKWIQEKDDIPAEQFISGLKICIGAGAQKVVNELSDINK